jgi:hypothetical protein
VPVGQLRERAGIVAVDVHAAIPAEASPYTLVRVKNRLLTRAAQ